MELVNERRNNALYKNENKILKIFNKGYSKEDVFLESYISSKVEALNINIPSLEKVFQNENGQWTFVYPDFYDKTLFDYIEENPDNIDEYLSLLVDIQTSIHTRKCPNIPIQKEKFIDYINIADLDKYMKIDLIDMLNSSPKHKKLCHGNLTPHNIIIGPDKEVYITDWNHTTQGNASADVARTYLWLLVNMPQYAEMYLKKFCEKTNTSSKYVHNWIPIVAAARLAKNNPNETKILREQISVIEY